MTSEYMNNLYRDLLSNSPQTVTIPIPSDMGTGQIAQVVTKQGAVVSDWKMNYFSDMNVRGINSEDYIQMLFCLNDGVSWNIAGSREGACLAKEESCIYRGHGKMESLCYAQNSDFYFKNIKIPVPYLQKVKISSEHLLLLLNNVLDLSRIENGKVSFSPEPENLPVLIDNVIAIMDGLLLNRDLTFEIHRNIPKELYVLTDATKIREILTNLLSNSVKFTKDGGTITFEISIKPGIDERHIVGSYVVKDNGIGMSEEFQNRLFEPFSQEDNGARTHYAGTGLGMAISKQYVELMGGTITVHSKKECGSSFTVEIPMELADPKQIPELNPIQDVSLNGVKVLLAEDNELNAELATTLLEEAGMHVTRAVDGQDAVACFANNPADTYDVILMDVLMPKMNGHQAARAIRAMSKERPDAAKIPIIAQSANAFKEDVQASLDSGMNGHISKPFNIDAVTTAIKQNIKR